MTSEPRPTRRALLRGGLLASVGLAGCLNRATPGDAPEAPDGDAVRWTHWAGGPVRHAPTVENGVVYVAGGENDRATSDGEHLRPEHSEDVLALDAGDGAERWRYEAPAGVVSEPMVGGAAETADGVYAVVGWGGPMGSGRDQRLVRIDGGERTWASDALDQNRSLLAVGEDAAYLGTLDDAYGVRGEQLDAIATDDGSRRWSVEAGDARSATLHGDAIYLEEGGRTVARDRADGDERWHRGAPAGEAPRVADDALFVEGERNDAGNHPVVAVDAADGSELWRFVRPVDEPFVPTGAVRDGDVVYVTEYGGWLFAVDAADGDELWRYELGVDARDPATVAGETVYLAGNDGTVHAVDAASGDRRWQRSLPAGLRIVAANEAGLVVHSDGEERLEELRAYGHDGTERWSFSSEEQLTGASVVGSRVYVATSRGHVIALGAE